VGPGQWSTFDRSTVNSGRVQTGPVGLGLGRSGLGRAKHVACCGAATSRPWALIGLRPQHGSHRVAHGGPALLVHGPKAGSMVDRAHRHFSSARLMCTGCRATLLTLPLSPLFLPRCAPASDVLTGELPQRLRHPIEVGKSLPMPWRLQWWSQGDGWCILSHWSRRTAARAQPACGNGVGAACGCHSALAGMLGRSRGPPGPSMALSMADGLAITLAASVWGLWPRRAS
jgi:hypothetical protein